MALTHQSADTHSGVASNPKITSRSGAHGDCVPAIPHGHHVNGKTTAMSCDVLQLLKREYPSIGEKERTRRLLVFSRIGDFRCILNGLEAKAISVAKEPSILFGMGQKIAGAVTKAAEVVAAFNEGDGCTRAKDVIAITEEEFEEDFGWSMVAGEDDLDDWTVVASEDWLDHCRGLHR